MFFGVLLFTLSQLTGTSSEITVTSGNPQTGTLSPGYVSLARGGTITQGHHGFPPEGPTLTVSDMTSLLIDPQAVVIQQQWSGFTLGNFTDAHFYKNCHLSMDSHADVRPSRTYGSGYMLVYCSASWSLDQQTFVEMEPQSFLDIAAPLSLGSGSNIELHSHTALQILSSLALQNQAHLRMQAHSFFTTQSASTVTITSEQLSFLGTTVILGPSSRLTVNGALTIGEGRDSYVELQDSGLVSIGSGGLFQIASSRFIVGPSSFWYINGKFTVKDEATLESGLQSNLTINPNGFLNVYNASQLLIGDGATAIINGTIGLTGKVVLDSSSEFTIGEGSSMAMFGNNDVQIGAFGGLRVGKGTTISQIPGNNIVIGNRAVLEFADRLVCTLVGNLNLNDYNHLVITEGFKGNGLLCY